MVSSNLSLSTFAAATGASVFLFAVVLVGTDNARANPAAPDAGPQRRPLELPVIRAHAEPGDETSALGAVEIALTQAGDGSTYYWQRGNGRLAGAIRVTGTFRDVEGRICRHMEVRMRLGSYTRNTEGIACRGTDGVWLLEG